MKIRILLADDASFIRDLIKRTLRKFLPQAEIFEASDGRKAQSFLNRQPIDLVLSDWEMPEISGEELLQWVRSKENLADIPFIMITSLGGKDNILRAVEAGVSDYLGKPFTAEELMQKVHKALVKSGKIEPVRQESNSRTGPFSSLEILSGKPDPSLGSVDVLTAGTPSKQPPSKFKGTALLHWGDIDFKCMIKTINADEVLLVSKRGERHPGVFEMTSLTLSTSNQANKSINNISAYVHSISALDKREDADFFQMLLRFTRLSLEQKNQLAAFIVDNP